MLTYNGLSEEDNRQLMRCSGVIRKYGWPDNAAGMLISLSGPSFYYDEHLGVLPFHWTKGTVEGFMAWQDRMFG